MDKILFVKYSNDRANRFAICTEIFANGDKKLLKKRATTESAREHIKNIRAKLTKYIESPITTVWGIGYKWI